MTGSIPGVIPPIVGRDDEAAAVLALVHDAVQGCAGTLLVSGEAGIGKTSLVRQACAAAADRIDMIWASCLPLASRTSIGCAGGSPSEAVDAGVLRSDAERYWFAHPLLAEVLMAGLVPDQRRVLHAAFAAASTPPDGSPAGMDVDEVVGLADHYHQAGDVEAAYRWALHGSAVAGASGGAAEMVRLLRRALELRPAVPEPGASQRDLLQRIRVAARQAGEEAEELAQLAHRLSPERSRRG